MKHILLLADADELPGLTRIFWNAAPDARVQGISSRDELDQATAAPDNDLRLIAFCTDVIVPDAVLGRLPGPAYNVHPGPPWVRGVYPSVFALYDGLDRFGATLHELTAEIDAGPIVAVDEAPIAPAMDRLALETLARDLVTGLLTRMAPNLLTVDGPLPHLDARWSGPAWSKKNFEALCHLPDDIDEAEFRRRLRAVGEGPDHALYFEKFGRRFPLALPARTGPVVKGGRPVGS
ncbi:MAG: formyltransferase family protein [Rhodospirillales bacterium]